MKVRPEHHRKSTRLREYDYSQPGAYYVTIVTGARACLFGEIQDGQVGLSEAGHVAEVCWQAIPLHFSHVKLGVFVVMPNHVHGILVLHDQAAEMTPPPVGATQSVAPTPDTRNHRAKGPRRGSIAAIVGAYKMAVTRQLMQTSGGATKIWQRNYYERVVRDDRDHQNIHQYIVNNPLNWQTDDYHPT